MGGEIVIRKETPLKNCKKRKQFFYEFLMGNDSEECQSYDLVKVSKSNQQLVFVHVISDSRSKGTATKVLWRVIKRFADIAAVVETNPENYFRKCLSMAKFVAEQLPGLFVLQKNLHDGMVVFRSSARQIGGFRLSSGPRFYPDENNISSREEFHSFSETRNSEDVCRSDKDGMEDGGRYSEKVSLKSISVIRRELPEPTFGWPLLRRTALLGHPGLRKSQARSMSLIEWVMCLPNRSTETIMRKQFDSDSEKAAEDSVAQEIHSSGNESVAESSYIEDEKHDLVQDADSGSVSEFTEQSTPLKPGWPLVSIKTSATASIDSFGEFESRNESVGSRATSQSSESTQDTPTSTVDSSFREVGNSPGKDFCHWEAPSEQRKKAKLVGKLRSSGCKQFSYKEIESATHNFSSENFIGEGGCSNVYKGFLRWGKQVAIKVLKQYKEASKDFSLEVYILSSLKHKHITQLIGACMEDDHLILVYNFLSRGSLEEILQGHNDHSTLPWKMRFKVAIAVAEALNYLHSECSRPVIHRDVKSSNILLSRDFQPQLSDFGLAMWGPGDSDCMISSDIVGTFGYIAPEYIMNGRISDKTDMYSFGVILLELLTGKKPISSEFQKGQESLVKWATPMLESGNLEELLDPKLGVEFDQAQVQKMVLAATLCVKQSPRLRPKADQILKLLREDKGAGEQISTYIDDLKGSSNEEVDEYFPQLKHKLYSDSPSLNLDDDTSSLISTHIASISSVEHRHRPRLKDHLKEPLI